VDEEGNVVKSQVNVTSGYPALDASALKAVQKFHFTPARNDGKVTPVWISIDVVFDPAMGAAGQ
jgi:TonB family protein